MSSDVGLTFELHVWAPKIRALVAGRRLEDDAFDDCVFRSLDVLPVPVVQVPMEEARPTVDLGRVGEALVRLEAAGKVRSLDCVDRRMWMRRGGAL